MYWSHTGGWNSFALEDIFKSLHRSILADPFGRSFNYVYKLIYEYIQSKFKRMKEKKKKTTEK